VADRTVRAVFEASVSRAQKGLRDLAGDADKAGAKVDAAAKSLKDLSSVTAKPKIDLAIEDAQRRLAVVTKELGELRQMKSSPEVDLQVREAQSRLRSIKSELKDLQNAKAQIPVKADTSQAEKQIASLGSKAGKEAGDEAGANMVSGIVEALGSIPIAGAVIGAGAAIAGGIILGIKQGLAIEAERDLFSAKTGFDEATSARFGRAAGEAYANAWGTSIADNLDTARVALEQGLINRDSIERDVEAVIASLSGISQIMEADIPTAARAAGQLIKTGLAGNAQQAFDVLVAGYQNGADASHDLLDTLVEYPTHFRDLGLSAQDAVGLLTQGLKGGAFNADKVADSLKELTIRVKDLGDKNAGEALKKIGLGHEDMARKFAEGGPAAREGLQQILNGLRGVEDPAARAQLAVALFGTQAEDMAGALASLDLSTAAQQLGGIEGAAGAADRALATMSDNTSTKIESAKRNIEVAMDGIKGALAEAFGDEISGVADWVSKNRAPLMQFFLDVMNGALDVGTSMAEMSATALDALAGLIEGMAGFMEFLPGVDSEATDAMKAFAESARTGADVLRTKIPAALDETKGKINDWAGPELLKARVHDATTAMAGDMDEFSAKVDASGGTVTINGETLTAEQALDVLVANIDGSDGTVSINGNRVPADQALSALMGAVRASRGSVTVGANTAAAESAIANLTRDRYVRVYAVGMSTLGGTTVGPHDGGWTPMGALPGRHAGGRVPGTDPGYDNILWPLNYGGRTLQQPLTGGEMVVNSKDAAYWAPVLEWMNAGGRPSSGGGSAAFGPSDVAAALNGARLKLGPIDPITREVAATLLTAHSRSV
jgi:phage-related minor tail protein